jgi:hypothetical protein
LKVKANKSALKLGNYTKLATRFCGLFEIMDIIEPMAYMFALHASMKVHNVFHVSLLKKYVHDPNCIIHWTLIQVDPKGDFHVQLVRILDKKVTKLLNKVIVQGPMALLQP